MGNVNLEFLIMDDILKNPEKKPTPAAYYAILFPLLQQVAKDNGYALAMHGSLVTDLDLIAVPWTAEAVEPVMLMEAFLAACGGRMVTADGITWHEAKKPHGRMAYNMILMNHYYIDVSVMPRIDI